MWRGLGCGVTLWRERCRLILWCESRVHEFRSGRSCDCLKTWLRILLHKSYLTQLDSLQHSFTTPVRLSVHRNNPIDYILDCKIRWKALKTYLNWYISVSNKHKNTWSFKNFGQLYEIQQSANCLDLSERTQVSNMCHGTWSVDQCEYYLWFGNKLDCI